MRQGQNKPRRNSGIRGARRPVSIRQNMDSNGPSIRIRGTAAQIYDKYIGLARDAAGSGDWVLSENLLQHAEHYIRLINENSGPGVAHADRSGMPSAGSANTDLPEHEQPSPGF